MSLARIAVEKNTLLAIEALRGLKGRVHSDLYGPIYDVAYWARCQQAMDQLPEGVKVAHGRVAAPREVPAVLAGYHACLMPSAGENFGHTMLEALTQGVPLVTSDRTWRDLEAKHAGWDLLPRRSHALHHGPAAAGGHGPGGLPRSLGERGLDPG